MSAKKEYNILVLKNREGSPLRFFQVTNGSFYIAQNKFTKRIELLSLNEDPEIIKEYAETYILLDKINFKDNEDSSSPGYHNKSFILNGIGSISAFQKNDQISHDITHPSSEAKEKSFPLFLKWSSVFHSFILGLLITLSLLFSPTKKEVLTPKVDSVVTIDLKEPQKPQPVPLVEKLPVAQNQNTNEFKKDKVKKLIKVVPRTDKKQSLLVKNKFQRKNNKSSQSKQKGFLRMSTEDSSLASITNALRGSRTGSGSGLKLDGAARFGGQGRGAGFGKGNGTMGHGNDSGGGYAQALYGKGLLTAQVGNGQGGFGSGWGDGRKGSGSYGNSIGTKGKAGGHEGYGTSKWGRAGGSTVFAYPVQEETVVQGGLDREAVDLVVMKNIGQITYCYEIGLQKKSNLRGRVLVDFTINSKGYISALSISSSSLHAPNVESCMLSKIKGWKFPQPVGGVSVDVNYPFSLQRVSQN